MTLNAKSEIASDPVTVSTPLSSRITFSWDVCIEKERLQSSIASISMPERGISHDGAVVPDGIVTQDSNAPMNIRTGGINHNAIAPPIATSIATTT